MARPSFKPTDENRRQVEAFVAYGANQAEISELIGCTEKTLRRHFRRELDRGALKANMKVAESLMLQAVGAPAVYDADGNVLRKEQPRVLGASIFWLKTRAGWSEYAPKPYTPLREPRPTRLGKKEEAALAAQNPDPATPMGELMARRAAGKALN